MKTFIFALGFLLTTLTPAHAIPETSIPFELKNTLLPFLKSGTQFSFATRDGLVLSAVQFKNPNSVGTIVLLPGRSEPWLKYAEVFFDLYQKGYSILSYDHRGQGLSPHLSRWKPQIGHVKNFNSYLDDLDQFVRLEVEMRTPATEPLYLLAHSMGGAIAAGYLSQYKNPFSRAILSAPMLQVNTKPYPEPIARVIVAGATLLGLGDHYAIGQKDYDPETARFEDNIVTGSRARFEMSNEIYKLYPETIIGGASSSWVNQSIKGSRRIRKSMTKLQTPTLLFQAGSDQLVIAKGQNTGCLNAGTFCTLIQEIGSEHEIMMERDSIRDDFFSHLNEFFRN